MKILTQVGSKERFLEMFQRVNKISLNEDMVAGTGEGLSLAERMFDELMNGKLNIKQTNSQGEGNNTFVELAGTDEAGTQIVFRFRVTATQGDQDGVLNVESATLESLKVGDNEIPEESNEIKKLNAEKGRQMIDIVGKSASDNSEENPDLYEEAIKKIDSYPFGGTPERMQTNAAYGDEKPTNPAVRVKAPVLQKFAPEGIMEEAGVDEMSTVRKVGNINPDTHKIVLVHLWSGAASGVKVAMFVKKEESNAVAPEGTESIWTLYSKRPMSFVNPEILKNPEVAFLEGQAAKQFLTEQGYKVNQVNKTIVKTGVQEETMGDDDMQGQELQRFNQEINTPQNPEEVGTEVEDEPIPEATEEEKQKIWAACDAVIQKSGKPDYMPTSDEVMAELGGKKAPTPKSRTYSDAEEFFTEGEHSPEFYQAIEVGRQAVIRQAADIVDQKLGANKDNVPHDKYIMLVQDEINKIMQERSLAVRNECMNEEEATKSDYPDQLGKKFKPKEHYPKKKRKPQSTVKLSENDVEDDFEIPDLDVPADKKAHKQANIDMRPEFGKSMEDTKFQQVAEKEEIEVPAENVEVQTGDDQISHQPMDDEPEGSEELNVSVPAGEMNGENNPHEPEAEEMEDIAQDKEEAGEQIPGGKGEGKSPLDFDSEQVLMGMRVEMEHTDDPMIALEITLDHLTEDPEYYTVGDENPEDSAQQNAAMDAEKYGETGDDEEKEKTDVLLGFKPHNVGDEADSQEIPEPSDSDASDEPAGEETPEETPEEPEEKEEEPEESPEEKEEKKKDEPDENEGLYEENKKINKLITEEQVKIAKQTLSNRNVPTGMTKKEAVQILIKSNMKIL
jgi:hypothetical protein